MKKAFKDDESKIPGRVGGPRARGFRAMISKFEHKVTTHVARSKIAGNLTNPFSSPICISLSTPKLKAAS